ncbi:MAG: hypothetical protein IT425_07535 [Pirellulales bacterium]|nr:hypothetical protein [Pirellulales bacterium]
MILYVLIVLILASFVFTFLGTRVWHWGYVLLVEAVFLATLGFFVLAAETLRVNAVLRSQVNRQETELLQLQADNDALHAGSEDAAIMARLRNGEPALKIAEEAESMASLGSLNHELMMMTRRRGRVWRNVTPAAPINPQTGAIQVNIASPAPSGLDSNGTVVFVFEEGAPQPPGENGALRGPQYLGEFTVAQVSGQQAQLVPVNPLLPSDYQTRRLAGSRGPWVMYETMPTDRHEVYAAWNDEQLQQLLPKATANEFVRHGKEATTSDDPHRKVRIGVDNKPLLPDDAGEATKVIYQRRLRDYDTEFNELTRRRIRMVAEIDAVKKDIEQLTAAMEVANKLEAYRTTERQKLTAELEGIRKERETIERHLAKLEEMLAKARQLTAEALARNRQMVAELAARQLAQPAADRGASAEAESPAPLALGR